MWSPQVMFKVINGRQRHSRALHLKLVLKSSSKGLLQKHDYALLLKLFSKSSSKRQLVGGTSMLCSSNYFLTPRRKGSLQHNFISMRRAITHLIRICYSQELHTSSSSVHLLLQSPNTQFHNGVD